MAKKAVVIGGQTASGKSNTAINICEKFGGEVISADSMQVYRKMDIGTAKPEKSELLRVRHHLIDILDIEEPFSSARFTEEAGNALKEITSRNKLPVVTGGTGLYSQMLFNSFNLEFSAGNGEIRKILLARAEREGADALYEELVKIDPVSAEKTHRNNVRRVARYLEIFYATGKTFSEMNEINNSGEKIYDPLYICMFSADREIIYERINSRVDKMLERGLIHEVRSLYDMGLENTPTASAAIGYKEFFPYFRGEITEKEAIEKVKQNSRNYAKRQQTYFKRIEGCVFADICREDCAEVIENLIRRHLEG